MGSNLIITYQISEFKSRCLKIMAEVAQSGIPVEITKRGASLVRVIPATANEPSTPYGALNGTARWSDDLFATDERWDVFD